MQIFLSRRSAQDPKQGQLFRIRIRLDQKVPAHIRDPQHCNEVLGLQKLPWKGGASRRGGGADPPDLHFV